MWIESKRVSAVAICFVMAACGPAGGPESEPIQNPSFLVGVWKRFTRSAGELELKVEFRADGTFETTEFENGREVRVAGRWSAVGHELTFSATEGSLSVNGQPYGSWSGQVERTSNFFVSETKLAFEGVSYPVGSVSGVVGPWRRIEEERSFDQAGRWGGTRKLVVHEFFADGSFASSWQSVATTSETTTPPGNPQPGPTVTQGTFSVEGDTVTLTWPGQSPMTSKLFHWNGALVIPKKILQR